jgi:hypothetical protein
LRNTSWHCGTHQLYNDNELWICTNIILLLNIFLSIGNIPCNINSALNVHCPTIPWEFRLCYPHNKMSLLDFSIFFPCACFETSWVNLGNTVAVQKLIILWIIKSSTSYNSIFIYLIPVHAYEMHGIVIHVIL